MTNTRVATTPASPASPAAPGADVRSALLLLVVACLLPAIGAAIVTIAVSWFEGRRTLEGQARDVAVHLGAAVDDEIRDATRQLEILARSPAIATGDFRALGDEVRRMQPWMTGSNVVLTGIDGQQRFNSMAAEGSALPRHGNPDFQRRVIERGVPAVSDLFLGGLLKRPLVVVEVPVRVEGRITGTLAMGFLPVRFAEILARWSPGPDQIVSVFDSNGTIVARTHEAARFVGHPGAPALVAAMRQRDEGVIETRTVEGLDVIAAWKRSAATGWSVGVGVPRQVLLGRLERWTAWVAFVAFAASAIGLFVAGLIARRLAGSIRALIEPARALGEGRPVRVPGVTFREVASVAAALQAASALLHDRTLERDSAKRTSELLRRDAAHFEHAAHHDPLTGLPNRTHFLALLDETLRRHEGTGTPFTVLFLDLDDFKPVNDTHGHAVGDELLKAVAGRLAVAVRERDTVARLGGDEFALLIEGHSPTDAAHIARGLVERLSRPYTIGALTLRISASVGAAGWPDDGLTATELISAADTEMYRAKAGGKSGFSASGQMPL